jgi:hypothetical protein
MRASKGVDRWCVLLDSSCHQVTVVSAVGAFVGGPLLYGAAFDSGVALEGTHPPQPSSVHPSGSSCMACLCLRVCCPVAQGCAAG